MLNAAAVRAARQSVDEVQAVQVQVDAEAILELRRLRALLERERAVAEAARLRYEALGGRINGELWERAVREVRAVADGS